MKYAMLIYSDPDHPPEAIPQETRERFYAATREVILAPTTSASVRLLSPDAATTVRSRGGDRVLTDGPFLDTKEYLGGVIVVEADNLDEALGIANRLQEFRTGGAIEVRPLMDQQLP